MSVVNSEQLHHSTSKIYATLTNEFNPNLQRLVSLGNSYVRAFQALAETSESYFSALSQIGQQASHSLSSRSIGDVLLQMCESQQRLTSELRRVFHWFAVDVLQEMDSNVRLDTHYISASRTEYEMNVSRRAAALPKRLPRETNPEWTAHMQFLTESHREALKEEERRYHFVAEKHCGLIQSFSRLMDQMGGSLQTRVDSWREEVNTTRERDSRRPSTLEHNVHMREEVRSSREELGRAPSKAPSLHGSVSRSTSGSVVGGGQLTRALVDHRPGGTSPTLLPFSKGEKIWVLVPKPKNGWLYGSADSSSRQGWFPASYVEEVDDLLRSAISSSSLSTLINTPESNTPSGGPPPPPPPPSSNKHSEATPTADRRAGSNQEKQRLQPSGSRPELFPRGTNPFATVKLKPTSTNDRSTPRLKR